MTSHGSLITVETRTPPAGHSKHTGDLARVVKAANTTSHAGSFTTRPQRVVQSTNTTACEPCKAQTLPLSITTSPPTGPFTVQRARAGGCSRPGSGPCLEISSAAKMKFPKALTATDIQRATAGIEPHVPAVPPEAELWVRLSDLDQAVWVLYACAFQWISVVGLSVVLRCS